MLNEDSKSVIIAVSKKRLFSDKPLVIPLNKKQRHVTSKQEKIISDTELKKYALPEVQPLPIYKLKQLDILLPFKQYSKQQDRDRFRKRLKISIYEKYKIISTDLHKRLKVDNPINDTCCVTDIDEDYYSYLERPLRCYSKGLKSFQTAINKILQLRQEAGIKRDCVLNIETNYRNELDTYDLSVKRLTDQAKYFDEFISEDYKKSMDFLGKWDKIKFQVHSKIKELQDVATDKFTTKSRLIGLEYKYSLQQKYGRFLYYVSPPAWRLNNREFARSIEIEAKGFDFGISQEEDTFAIIFEKLRKICYGNPIRPALYFTQPKDLMDVFGAMENQQLHYYTHVNYLTPNAKILKKSIQSLKDVIFQDYAVVANSIVLYENLLNFYEDRCTQLEVIFLKILFGFFYNSVGVTDVLKLILHLEFCYEKVFFEKPVNMDITIVAKAIEKLYMDYSKQFDDIQSSTVRCAILKSIEIERLKTQKAKHAAKELHSFHKLERALLKAHGMNTHNEYKPIKIKSIKKINNFCAKPNIEQNKKTTLSESEMEYLLLFTDWTETEDPSNYLQSLNLNKPKY